jgi:dUTP pyrophosphatase
MRVRIKVCKLRPEAILPRYAHSGENGDLAADLFCLDAEILQPGDVKSIRTGITIEFPDGFGALIEDRSGLALKGISTLAGVIDPGYRGEIVVVLTNVGRQRVEIKKGDRVAQLRLVQRIQADFIEVPELGPSDRGTRGFGSTGE